MLSPDMKSIPTPDEAIQRLIDGNNRFVKGNDHPDPFEHIEDQSPYACILGCADSRVSPEHTFDESHGHLFVTRIAGNFVTPEIIASLEYGTNVLEASVILVLGHTSCGAINAAIKSHSSPEAFSGHIETIISALEPAVTHAHDGDLDKWKKEAVKQNVLNNVTLLRNAEPVLSTRIKSGILKIVGGIYDLSTGKVEFLDT